MCNADLLCVSLFVCVSSEETELCTHIFLCASPHTYQNVVSLNLLIKIKFSPPLAAPSSLCHE